ncbi:MAG: helix-turn-helix domain-containing protein [Rhizobiaceae bacterium]
MSYDRTENSVEEISWAVGYEDPSAFRRLFKRISDLSPSGYRRKFQVPNIGSGVSESGRQSVNLQE